MGIIFKIFIELLENCIGFIFFILFIVFFYVILEFIRNCIKYVKYVYIFLFKCIKFDLYFLLRFIYGFKKFFEK